MACDAPLILVCGMAFEAKLARGEGILPVYGLEPERILNGIGKAARAGAAGILSFGTAAGLDPALAPGTVIVARQVIAQTPHAANDAWAKQLLQQLPGAMHADIAGVDYPLTFVARKTALRQESGAAVADMESHHVARAAQRYGLPFAALRVVLDDAESSLPPAALAAPRPNGNINYIRLLASLLLQPGQLPALIALAGDQAKAKAALVRCGRLLKDSRFGLMHLGG